MLIIIIIASLLAYLFGSISSAIIVCKVMGLPDPRKEGSGNPGATNVLRLGGKKAALMTLMGDMLKGFIPVFLAKWVGLNESGLALVTFFAFLGHLFPIFFRFEGGKGVATALGCLFALNGMAALCWLLTWLIVALLTRYASLASLIATLLAPLYVWIFSHQLILTMTFIVISLFLFYRHRTNIIHLVQGNERKIGKNSPSF